MIHWVQTMTLINPVRHFVDIMHRVMLVLAYRIGNGGYRKFFVWVKFDKLFIFSLKQNFGDS